MSIEAPHADITFIEGTIVQVDIYIPEVRPGEVVIGVDLAMFTEQYPLTGGVTINQEVEGRNDGYVVAQSSRATDTLNIDADLDPEDLAYDDEALVINQYIGKIGRGGIVVGVCTYDMDQAMREAPEAVVQAEMAERLMQSQSQN